jgi:probable F420-dependent oxidoreductase
MKLGVQLAHVGPTATPEAVRSSACAAEELGYDSVWVIDRLLAPAHPSVGYGGSDQAMPVELAHNIDPLAALGFAAAVTDRVGLGTSILCAPFYAPPVLARSLTGLDVLSGGRLQVGLGQGWSPEELAAVGSSLGERAARLDELLDVLEAWWGEDPVAHEGRTSTIAPSVCNLQPVQRPRPPVLLAAYSPAGFDRVARRADGWNPAGLPVDALAPTFAGIRDAAAAYGRDADALRLVVRANVVLTPNPVDGGERESYVGDVEQVADDLAATADAGAHEVILGLPGDGGLDATLDAYAALAEGLEVRVTRAAARV